MADFLENKRKNVSDEEKQQIRQTKAKEKKLVKKFAVVFLAAAVIVVGVFVVTKLVENKSEEYEYVTVEQIAETYPTLNPYTADFEKDLSGYYVPVMYVFPDGNACDIKEIPDDTQNEAHRFFTKYFDMLKKGDYENYGAFFTKSYKKDPKGFEKDFSRIFPPQKLSDIKVKELMRSTDTRQQYKYEGKNCFFGYYLVSYKIVENDGMFRRDLYRAEVERPLVFELVTFDKDTENEVTLIKNIYTESSIPQN